MKPFRLAALSLALLTAFSLTGCDDSGAPQATAPTPAADSGPGAAAKPDSAQLAALAENLAARWGLLPFHAVGTDGGLLLYFRPDSVLRADGTALDCVCAVSAVSIGQGVYEGLIGV